MIQFDLSIFFTWVGKNPPGNPGYLDIWTPAKDDAVSVIEFEPRRRFVRDAQVVIRDFTTFWKGFRYPQLSIMKGFLDIPSSLSWRDPSFSSSFLCGFVCLESEVRVESNCSCLRSEAPSVASLGRRSVVSAQSGGDHRGTTHGNHGWVMGGSTVLENTGGIRRKYGYSRTRVENYPWFLFLWIFFKTKDFDLTKVRYLKWKIHTHTCIHILQDMLAPLWTWYPETNHFWNACFSWMNLNQYNWLFHQVV